MRIDEILICGYIEEEKEIFRQFWISAEFASYDEMCYVSKNGFFRIQKLFF